MATFTYRIETNFSDTEGWGIEDDDARGTEHIADATADDVADEIADNRRADLEAEQQTGEWRVLAWEGDTEGDAANAAATCYFSLAEEDYRRGRGRPAIGPEVKTRLAEHEVAQVDAIAASTGLSRAQVIRQAVQGYLAQQVRTYTLVSAVSGDQVPGVEISDPACPVQWERLPADAQAWAQEQGYGRDDDELLYVLEGSENVESHPSLRVTMQG